MNFDWLEDFQRTSLFYKASIVLQNYEMLRKVLYDVRHLPFLKSYKKIISKILAEPPSVKYIRCIAILFHYQLREYLCGAYQSRYSRLGSREIRAILNKDTLLRDVQLRLDRVECLPNINTILLDPSTNSRHWLLVWHHGDDTISLFDSTGCSRPSSYSHTKIAFQTMESHTCGYHVLYAAYRFARGCDLKDLEREFSLLGRTKFEQTLVNFVKDVMS